MRNSEVWANDIIHHIRRVRSEAERIPPIRQNTIKQSDTPSSPPTMDGAAIARALSDFCKNDNSITQALAIRLANLAERYPQRAA